MYGGVCRSMFCVTGHPANGPSSTGLSHAYVRSGSVIGQNRNSDSQLSCALVSPGGGGFGGGVTDPKQAGLVLPSKEMNEL